MTAPAAPDYRQHLEVETPEHLVLDYEIAGLGSRALAAVLDALLLLAWTMALLATISLASVRLPAWGSAISGLLYFASLWGYFAFFEGLRGGQTPGKRRVGIRVVQDTGHAVNFGSAAVRNLLRAADFLPPPYLLGALFVALHPRGKRLGDLVAGTVVVRDRPAEGPLEPARPWAGDDETAGAPELADEEYRVLREFTERAPALDPAVRSRLAARLAGRFADRVTLGAPTVEAGLAALYHAEAARRRGRFGSQGAGTRGTSGTRRGVADRLVARQTARWEAFDRLAARASRDGLDSFAAPELPDFAARYREIAADLARARTYRAGPAVLQRLERLVAAGHNALYRSDRHTPARLWNVVARECPAAVIQARRAVLVAFLTFTAPALAGFVLLRERPAMATELLPDVILDRAEAGAARQQSGRGFVEVETAVRPAVASQIITNNIGVAFFCFAGGIFAGVGSLVLLAYNGLSIGATSAHFANSGLLGYLWTFIVGHGALELFAIWVAGAAGFLLGRALVAPGELARDEALVLEGRVAIRMIGAVIVLLLLAGGIEGFVSAGGGSLDIRLAVSGASLVFLAAYLANGALYLRNRTAAGARPEPALTPRA